MVSRQSAHRWHTHKLGGRLPLLSNRPTVSYLPSQRASSSLDWYQIILLGDRGTSVWTTCPELLPGSAPGWS